MKISKKLFLIIAFVFLLNACSQTGDTPKESKSIDAEEKNSVDESLNSDNTESLDNKQEDESVQPPFRPETKEILNGMNDFKSDVVKHYSQNETTKYDVYYYEKYALAELMVRAEHEKAYDYIKNLEENNTTGVTFPLMSEKEAFVNSLNKINSQNLYDKYPDLIIANYQTASTYGYESLEKAEKDPETYLLRFEINDIDLDSEGGEFEEKIFPYYPRLTQNINIQYQYEPEVVEKLKSKSSDLA